MTQERQMCTFMVGDLFCGLPVDQVQEVLRYREMTAVPLAPPEVRGLINLRGQIVTAIDLRHRLKLGELPPGQEPMNIVVHGPDGIVSLLVDEIQDVLELSDEHFEAPPDTMDPSIRDLLEGVHKLEDRLLLVLATDRVLAFQGSAES